MQMRVTVKGMNIEEQSRELGQQVSSLLYNTLNSIAEVIAQTSPVDSGTYARNHEVALRSGSFTPDVIRDPDAPRLSRGAAVDVEAARAAGLAGMKADIDAFGLVNNAGRQLGSIAYTEQNFVFRNPVTYASKVEELDGVYALAKREVGNAIAESVAKVRKL